MPLGHAQNPLPSVLLAERSGVVLHPAREPLNCSPAIDEIFVAISVKDKGMDSLYGGLPGVEIQPEYKRKPGPFEGLGVMFPFDLDYGPDWATLFQSNPINLTYKFLLACGSG
jgi:hypothetical protein